MMRVLLVKFIIYLVSAAAAANGISNSTGKIETQRSALLHHLVKRNYKYFEESISNNNNNQLQNYDDYDHIDEDICREGGRQVELMKEKDRIEKLPGQPPRGVKFNQYGGYVTVEAGNKAMYYYFVEAENKPESAPLLLWLNGGPGCSSLAYGAMQELGPFRVNSDGKTLYRNKYAWNKVANVLFVESPAGVGFSYSNTTSDYHRSGDRKTARDNLVFLLNWMERFPEYKGRDFFISGESYAGHYVPQLARLILHYNKKHHHPRIIINLKGIMIGNGVLNEETDTKGRYDYWWTHALISDEVKDAVANHCNYSRSTATLQPACQEATQQANQVLVDIDPYNIYAPNCHSDDPITSKPTKPPAGDVIDPCSDYYVIHYLNTPEVQRAMHANITGHLHYQWQPCSSLLGKWTDSPDSVLPLLRDFIMPATSTPIRVLIFSGDTDGIVPVTSTRYSIEAMKLPVITKWHAWYSDHDGEVGGYTQVYLGNLTFSTVRGAGHQVPSYQPARSLTMITYFLKGIPLPPNSPS